MNQAEAVEAAASLAEGQWGMFTTAQAGAIGASRADVARPVRRQLARRLRHGVHMMAGVPSSPFEDIRAEWLATDPGRTAGQRRDDPEPAIVSDESAAIIHGIGDLPPGGVHLTSSGRSLRVPPRRSQTWDPGGRRCVQDQGHRPRRHHHGGDVQHRPIRRHRSQRRTRPPPGGARRHGGAARLPRSDPSALYPIENQIADKLSAMYSRYGSGPSTRYRDLYDLAMIVDQFPFDQQTLAEALQTQQKLRRISITAELCRIRR